MHGWFRRIVNWSATVAGTQFVILLLLVGSGWILAGSTCNNEIIQALPSPDGRYTAFLFQRDCGVTTSFSTQASVYPKGVQLGNLGGNIFVADLPGDGPTISSGGPTAHLRWTGDRNIEIQYHHTARTFLTEERRSAVKIAYVVR